jgi:putative aminopeptidase FrvX
MGIRCAAMSHLPPERLSFLRDLLRAHGPSGHEGPAAQIWRSEAETFARVDHDVLGSSYASVGPAEGAPVLLLGHIDEIGLIVSHIEDSDASYDGKLRVRPLGGWDPEVLVGQHVELRASDGRLVPGVVGKLPIHLAPKDGPTRSSIETLWVDIGARNAEDARELVGVGATAVLVGEARELANDQLASKALDNRTGAWIVLEAARRVAERGGAAVPVVACACAIEEKLGDGARAAAHRVDPAISIVVDVTHASDVPGGLTGTTGVQVPGRGPTITRGLGLNHKLTAALERVGKEAGITLQPEALSGGSSTYTDVDGALRALAGSAIGLVSIPLRHMHSPAEVCSLSDLDEAAELIAKLCLSLRGDEDWR